MIENIIPEFKVFKDKHKISFKIPFDYIDADDITVILKKCEIERVLEKEEYIIEDGVFKYPANDAIPYMKEECEVIIRRNTPIEQIESSDVAYKSKDIERISDKHTMIEQELKLGIDDTNSKITYFNEELDKKASKEELDQKVDKSEMRDFATEEDLQQQRFELLTVIASKQPAGNYATDEALRAVSEAKQNKLTAGANITIDANNVISARGGGEGGGANWGEIGGDITEQVDLQNALSEKQNTLIPGDNITIVNNVISSTGGGGGTSLKSAQVFSSNYSERPSGGPTFNNTGSPWGTTDFKFFTITLSGTSKNYPSYTEKFQCSHSHASFHAKSATLSAVSRYIAVEDFINAELFISYPMTLTITGWY